MAQKGILLIATSEVHLRAANMCARSVRDMMPGMPIDIFCDEPKYLDKENFDRIEVVEHPHRRSKVDCLPLSRFERTLYLDSDIRIIADLSELFNLLDKFDLALAHAHARNQPQTNSTWNLELPPSFPQYNGGVILYNSAKPEVIKFLNDWKDAYHHSGFDKDQVTLRELLWKSDLRLHTLPPEYNIRYERYLKFWPENEAAPKVLHFKRFKHDHKPYVHTVAQKTPKKLSLLKRLEKGIKQSLRGTDVPAPDDKVFCIGFHKTGTTSLTKALKILGYKTIHGDGTKTWEGADEGVTLTRMIDAGNFDLPTLQRFNAFSDNPYFSIWKELDENQTGKFILTVRDREKWIESCCRFYKDRRVRHMRNWMFGEHADPNSSPEAKQAWLDAYDAHNKAVRAHFDGRDDFMVLDVTKNEGWGSLCRFLDRPVPRKPFPHVNKTKAQS